MNKPRIQSFLIHFSALLFFFFGACYLTFPLILDLKHLAPGLGDELYITWIINWNIHALQHNIFNLFNGNIYFPYPNTLSYSDLHLASSLLAFLPVKVTGEPLLGYTINLILSLCLSGFFIYCLVNFLTKDFFSAIASGSLFSFSTFIIPKLGQLQVVSIFWIPLTLLCYFAYIKYKKFSFYLLALLFFYMQFINSFMPAYFLLLNLLGLTAYEVLSKRKKVSFFLNKKNLISLIVLAIFCLPIVYPYYYTSLTQNYVRDIREAINTGNRPEFFFYNFGGSYIGQLLTKTFYHSPHTMLYDGYRGFFNILLTFFVILFLFLKKKKPKYLTFFTISGIASYILSLGPALQFGGHVIKTPFIIPLPYALFYYFAPGFKGFRNSGRIEVYEIMVFAIASGIFISFLLRKKYKIKLITTILICFVSLLEFNFPLKFVKLPGKNNLPSIYRYLATQPSNTTIAEFPIYNWDMAPYSFTENKRLYFSSYHFTKTLNGGGGFSPFKWQEKVTKLAKYFPDKKSINILKTTGINHIVVHFDEFDTLYNNKFMIGSSRIPNGKMVKDTLDKLDGIKLIDKFDNTSYYEIL